MNLSAGSPKSGALMVGRGRGGWVGHTRIRISFHVLLSVVRFFRGVSSEDPQSPEAVDKV